MTRLGPGMKLEPGLGMKLEPGLCFIRPVTGAGSPSPALFEHTETKVAKSPFTPKHGRECPPCPRAKILNHNRILHPKGIKMCKILKVSHKQKETECFISEIKRENELGREMT